MRSKCATLSSPITHNNNTGVMSQTRCWPWRRGDRIGGDFRSGHGQLIGSAGAMSASPPIASDLLRRGGPGSANGLPNCAPRNHKRLAEHLQWQQRTTTKMRRSLPTSTNAVEMAVNLKTAKALGLAVPHRFCFGCREVHPRQTVSIGPHMIIASSNSKGFALGSCAQ
jgi:hypothetical protein